MKHTLFLLFLTTGLILTLSCASNKKNADNMPRAEYPEKDKLVPNSLLVDLNLLSLSENSGQLIYEAKIINVIRYGPQSPIVSKGSTISVLCASACSETKPAIDTTLTAIIISTQNMTMGEKPNSTSWEIFKLY